MKPILSVLVPVKNGEKHVRLAILSTLLALPEQSEIIVVNDGSTDKTVEIVSSIRDKRVRLFRNPGSGIVSALNFGLSQATGEFVARMDADDICFPWRFSLQLKRMQDGSKLDFLFGTAVAFGRPLAPFFVLPQLPWRLSPSKFMLILGSRNPAVHPTMIARKDAIDGLGGYSQRPAEDEHLWLRAGIKNLTLSRSAAPVIALRLHDGQTTRDESWLRELGRDPEIQTLREAVQASQRSSVAKQSRLFRALNYLEGNGLKSFHRTLDRLCRRFKVGNDTSITD